MNNTLENLKEDKIFYLLIGGMINIGILSLPNTMILTAKQDGWLSTIIGIVYPLYIVFVANFLKKVSPNENIFCLSKKYFGKYVGSVFNLLFGSLYFVSIISSGAAIIYFIYYNMSSYKTNKVVISLILIIGALAAHMGIKVLVKLCEISFFIGILISLLSINVLKYGSILNLMPIGDMGLTKIIKASTAGIYSYAGAEIILFMHPLFEDRKKLIKNALISIVIICLTYVMIVFTTTYYLGDEIIKKTLWSAEYLVDSLRFPIFNNLRLVVFGFWIFVVLKAIGVYYYVLNILLVDTFGSRKIKEYYLIIYVPAAILAFLIKNEISRRYMMENITKYVVVYNLIYVTLLLIIAFFKKGEIYEK
ncbi:GerAB/ArcD/ProY family transporter [Clostridium ganghwense]|uniref:Endospore germination permease n=1 Tax=Clostridium ganghwense TaxID=312089 RepID=A0ABT4CRM1_9CLOT|nr:endospore germination permease [Clostridium ganghwense]MCY6371706.1 endospore germination permease [Clostridium ganghwense]